MPRSTPSAARKDSLNRRSFLKTSSALVAGSALAVPLTGTAQENENTAAPASAVQKYRTLGRTEFKVSDISMGCGRINEANVVRYAYDRGINYFDTAETYGNGESERKIGDAMPHLDRKEVFITTKLWVVPETTQEEIVNRFNKCLDRMQTPYADALYLHGVGDVAIVTHAGFHAAVEQLKQEGKLRHAGISSHGPSGDEPDSMEKVLCAAAEDGRFDLMLLSYNFMNREEGEKVLAACKQRNIGTTGMKMTPGFIEVDPFDPENPTEEYADYLDRLMKRGRTREQAIARINQLVNDRLERMEKTKPFLKKHGIKTEEKLRESSLQWVLGNRDMHTICVSLPGFEDIDQTLPLSGTRLSAAGQAFIRDYEYAFSNTYCRHACNKCVASCPERTPVSTIMRYSYYYQRQGREKFAMGKYARLPHSASLPCLDCEAPCRGACPHGVNIQSSLVKAHTLLTMA
jgi:predicted aldo/keto reductase-like oxidoreductase